MMSYPSDALLTERKVPTPPTRKTRYDVVIIGSGPAGYTAGVYCSRARRETLILSGPLPGGQLMTTTDVENYPGFEDGVMGPDLMIVMKRQAEKMGAEIVDDEVVNIDFRSRPFKILTASEEYEAKAVIISTGATPRKLGIEGEEAFAGKGVSYCATCDGPFFRGKDLFVVGGGDSAMEEATFLTKFASSVHLIHRRDELRASMVMQERALADEKITMHLSCIVRGIKGDETVTRVTLEDLKTGQRNEMEAGGVFVAIGHEPNTKLFANQIEMDDLGYVVLKKNSQTSIPGVFAAGDVHDHRYRQAVTAAGYGCMAAIDVDKYLAESP